MEKGKRIMFLDLMRVIALFMMIQGHTTYDFLNLEIRDGASLGITIWTNLRGYTAPFFMMVSGAVFTFLMISQAKPDGSNPRIKVGLRRIFTLLFWGYMLNFPIYVIAKVFSKDGYDRLLQINVIETFFTILWISGAIFIYLTLTHERKDTEKRLMSMLFRKGAIKHLQFRERLFRKSFFTKEELKTRVNKSFFWGLIISIPFLIIANELTIEEVQHAFRVDVLHLIAIGLLTIMLVHTIFRGKIIPMGLLFFALAVAVAAMYPLVNNVQFKSIPIFIAPYLNNFEMESQFPITPWLSYIMMGGLLGTWLTHEIKKEHFEKRIGYKLGAFGILFLLISFFGDILETQSYGKSYYWIDSPNLIYHRIGVVLCVGSAMAFLSLRITSIPKVVSQMTRNTLFLYVGHLVVIYQLVKPILRNSAGEEIRFGIFGTILCVIGMFGLMFIQTQIIVAAQKRGGYIAWVKSFIGNSKQED